MPTPSTETVPAPSVIPGIVWPPAPIIAFSPGYQDFLTKTLLQQNAALDAIYTKLLATQTAAALAAVNAAQATDAAKAAVTAATAASIASSSAATAAESVGPAVNDRLDLIQEEVSALTAALENLLADLSRPQRLDIQLNGRSPIPMVAVSDVAFTLDVLPRDAAGRAAADAGPFTWSIAPPEAATVGDDPNVSGVTTHTLVTCTAPDASGNQADFTVNVTDGTLSGSLACSPTAGAATSLTVEASAT
jgi:hypothetical protein